MAQLTVVAKVVARPEAAEDVKKELLKMIAPTRAETGCLAYTLHQDNQEPNLFVFYETWEDETCLERHLASDHFKAYVAAVDGMLLDKTVYRLTKLA